MLEEWDNGVSCSFYLALFGILSILLTVVVVVVVVVSLQENRLVSDLFERRTSGDCNVVITATVKRREDAVELSVITKTQNVNKNNLQLVD